MVTLIKGDAIEKMKGIASKSVDLIICDLPYGCLTNQHGVLATGHKYLSPSATGCAWDIKIDLDLFWKEVKRIRKNDHTPCIHFCTTKFGFDLYNSNPKEFRYDLVWDKQHGVSFLLANKMPMRSHEMIYVFSKAGANYNRIDIKGDFKEWKTNGGIAKNIVYASQTKRDVRGGDGKRCALSVIQTPNGTFNKKNQHPTEKPIDLYKFLIERYSNSGDTVLDPTFGSGNSGKVCVELGRKYIGIEKDTEFYWKAVKSFLGSA